MHPLKWLSTKGEGYRRCCTSSVWVGEALAVRIFGAEDIWNQDSFFDYIERWMTEDDSKFNLIIESETGMTVTKSWQLQGQARSKFVEQMWAKYWYDDAFKPNQSVPTDTLEFTKVEVGDSKTVEFNLSNDGDSDLVISDIFCPEAVTVDTSSFTIAPEESLTVNITFSPKSIATYRGYILVLNYDSTNTIAKIAVTGESIPDTGVEAENKDTKVVHI